MAIPARLWPRRATLPSTIHLTPLWRRRPVLCATVLVTTLLAFIARDGSSSGNDDFARYHDRIFAVTRILDGDTFEIDAPDGSYASTRVRLWGVDSPETAHGPNDAMHYGPEASAFARRLLSGRSVRILLCDRQTRDKYDRLLAYAVLETTGENFNELLLSEGMAYADWRFPHPLSNEFKKRERDARKNGIGLWADITPEQMPFWRREFAERLAAAPPP